MDESSEVIAETSVEASLLSLQFNKLGFVVVPNVIDVSVIDSLHSLVMSYFHELMELIKSKELELGIGVKNGFKEIVQRHSGRFEMTYKIDCDRITEMLSLTSVRSIAESILEDTNLIIVNKSIVLSLPGSEVCYVICSNSDRYTNIIFTYRCKHGTLMGRTCL